MGKGSTRGDLDDTSTAHDPRNDSTKLSYLRATELFRDLTPRQVGGLHDRTHMRAFPAGHVFYRPGETGETLFILKHGAAQLYRVSPDGRKYVVALVPPLSVFGEMALVGQGMHACFAEATTESLICTLGRSDVTRLVLEHPSVGIRLLDILGRRIRQAEQQLEDLVFRSLVPRLADLLIAEGRDDVDGYSHQDLAERLGVYRETVTYALNELKGAGIICVGRRRIRVVNRPALARVATSG